jgi:glycerophosphoryl diester phosphodiesterase
LSSERVPPYVQGVHPFFDLPTPHLFGHRGASGEAPENTLPAFARARAQGVPYLEMDCHATRDGEIVVLHDAELERTTDGSGPVRGLALAELERLDAGYRFTPDGESFPFRGQGIRVPRLEEVLRSFPDARINLEIKQADPPIAERVVDLIRRAGAAQRMLLAADDDGVLEAVRSLRPGTAIGSSRSDVLDFFRALHEGRIEELEPRGQALQIPAEFMGEPLVTPASVAAARAHRLRVHVWTINDPAQMKGLLQAGADGLMSDFPSRLVRTARSAAEPLR